MVKISVNGRQREVDADEDTPLLWVLRDHLNMTGTKFGCGVGVCGACSVHIDGAVTRSCLLPVGALADKEVTTIENLGGDRQHALQEAWIEMQVPQCGYCQSGMLMAAASLLAEKPQPTDVDIDRAITNKCRCGTYPRVRSAIHRAARRG